MAYKRAGVQGENAGSMQFLENFPGYSIRLRGNHGRPPREDPKRPDAYDRYAYLQAAWNTSSGDMMKIGEKNVGTIDRVVRVIAGIAFLAGFAMNMVAAPLSYLVAIVGIVLIATGALGTCALYSLIGVNTAGQT